MLRIRGAIRKLLGRTLVGVALIGLLVALGGAVYQQWREHRIQAEFEPPGTLIEVGGYSLHLWCQGNDSRTVMIVLGGYGGTTSYAAPLSNEMAKSHRVCVFDPPGQGWSEAGPEAGRVPERFRAFQALIANSGIASPLVLVGESSGAHVVRLFAASHPSRVAGLVLIDPAFDDLDRERRHWTPAALERAARLRKLAHVMPALSQLGLHRLILGPALADIAEDRRPELRRLMREQALSRRSVSTLVDSSLHRKSGLSAVRETVLSSDLPLLVLTAGGTEAKSGTSYYREKVAYHRELSRLSTRGKHIVVEGASHAMIGDRPEQVAGAVHSVLEMAEGLRLEEVPPPPIEAER